MSQYLSQDNGQAWAAWTRKLSQKNIKVVSPNVWSFVDTRYHTKSSNVSPPEAPTVVVNVTCAYSNKRDPYSNVSSCVILIWMTTSCLFFEFRFFFFLTVKVNSLGLKSNLLITILTMTHSDDHKHRLSR